MEENYGCMNFLSWLTLLLIVAKLFGFINWSWWIVLAPIWITGGVVVFVLAIYGVMYLLEHRR